MKYAKVILYKNLLVGKMNEWIDNASWLALAKIPNFGYVMVLSSF